MQCQRKACYNDSKTENRNVDIQVDIQDANTKYLSKNQDSDCIFYFKVLQILNRALCDYPAASSKMVGQAFLYPPYSEKSIYMSSVHSKKYQSHLACKGMLAKPKSLSSFQSKDNSSSNCSSVHCESEPLEISSWLWFLILAASPFSSLLLGNSTKFAGALLHCTSFS